MADGDSSLSDDDQEFLLSGSEDLDGVEFNAASGINVGNLARTVVGTIGLALGTAAATLVAGVSEAWTSVLDSLAEFVAGGREFARVASRLARRPIYRQTDGLIGRLTESVTTPLSNAWSSALPDSGIAAWFVSLALVILTFYAAARGFSEVREVIDR